MFYFFCQADQQHNSRFQLILFRLLTNQIWFHCKYTSIRRLEISKPQNQFKWVLFFHLLKSTRYALESCCFLNTCLSLLIPYSKALRYYMPYKLCSIKFCTARDKCSNSLPHHQSSLLEELFNMGIERLEQVFTNNSFPMQVFDNEIAKFFSKKTESNRRWKRPWSWSFLPEPND